MVELPTLICMFTPETQHTQRHSDLREERVEPRGTWHNG